MEPKIDPKIDPNLDPYQQISKLSRKSFLWAFVAVGTGYGGWRWINSRRDDNGVGWVFRRAHEFNESLSRDFFDPKRLAPTFPRSAAVTPRSNGQYGVDSEIDLEAWRLTVLGLLGRTEPLELTIEQIKKLPRTEMTTEFKCIEGWSAIIHWAGVRFIDFCQAYPPDTRSGNPPDFEKHPEDLYDYVAMETPDGGYYVGLDTPSALHPQTLLAYEMNGEPLGPDHGEPLRLVIPVKYGIKNIKRIGTIQFTNERPKDYWAEQGYDWFSGH